MKNLFENRDLTVRVMKVIRLVPICLGLAATVNPVVAAGQNRQRLEMARNKMVDEAVIGFGVKDKRVIQSMRDTSRHEFVPRKFLEQAYQDSALPIGAAQTISSPFIVAFMTEAVNPQPTDRVLEIGTGSGYQAAVLSPLVDSVYTIEIVESLGKQASRVLKRLRYTNVHTRVGDGFLGWPEAAPFDKIIVTCSPEEVPKPLVDQLKEGGMMVIPVGEHYQQTLYLMRKQNGKIVRESLRPTLFVPMTGTAEQRREVFRDPGDPKIINGDFEEAPKGTAFVPGWYYQRQAKHITDENAPSGQGYLKFTNSEFGRSSLILQGIRIDGSLVKQVKFTATVKTENISPGPGEFDVPVLTIDFYDKDHRSLKLSYLGPFLGTNDWQRSEKVLAVPHDSYEIVIRLGMFGATGSMSVDQVTLEKQPN